MSEVAWQPSPCLFAIIQSAIAKTVPRARTKSTLPSRCIRTMRGEGAGSRRRVLLVSHQPGHVAARIISSHSSFVPLARVEDSRAHNPPSLIPPPYDHLH